MGTECARWLSYSVWIRAAHRPTGTGVFCWTCRPAGIPKTGLARRAALQINPYVRSLSADKMTYLMLGEPTLPSFTPPSQMGNAIGHREGALFTMWALEGWRLVLRYLPGAEFARVYGETALRSLLPIAQIQVSAQDRPGSGKARRMPEWPTVIPSRSDGGEARFTCTHNKQEMDVRVEAATRITRDNIGWGDNSAASAHRTRGPRGKERRKF